MFRSKLPLLLAQKEQKERRKITQKALADETNISANTISGWMDRNRDMPRLDGRTVVALCEYFECSLEELVDMHSSEAVALPLAS